MKKSLLAFLLFAIFSLQANAQIFTGCNPDFSWQFLSSNTVKFNPAITTDSPFVQHYWRFGDGSLPSNFISPLHFYASGTYLVRHYVVRHNPNGVLVCADSTDHQITIQGACNLNAAFTFQAAATNPMLVYFLNTSTGFAPGDSIRWTFGDGTASYTPNTSHLYANAGTYTVCLRVKKPQTSGTAPCISEICHQVQVAPTNNCNIQAYFSIDSLQPNVYHFVNQSPGYMPGDSIRWTFGDGTSSTNAGPTHTYTASGTYTVCLRIARATVLGTPPCIREYCKTITVTIPVTNPCNFQAYFSIDSLQPNVYHFNNQSPGLLLTDSIRWSFGDGSFSGTLNPTHIYSSPGIYTACLRIIRYTIGTVPCVREFCKIITVLPPPCNLSASFTSYRDTAVTIPNTYHFTNTSVPLSTADSIRWTFGDGTSSNQLNPNHLYAQPGSYNVCLRVIKRTASGMLTNCISEVCHVVIVPQPVLTPSCTQLSAYQFTSTAANPALFTFTPNYINNAVQYTWTFGDGTGSQNPTASHQYAAPGYYTVCLTAFRNTNCASTTCRSVYIGPNCSNITLGFTEIHDPLVPNRIKFTANSNNAISNQSWTIIKLPVTTGTGTVTINQFNPTYMFLDSGSYRVCLRVVFPGGCVKEFCKIIHISQSMPGTSSCTLQVYPNPASSVINAGVTLTQPLMLNAYVYNSMNMLVAQKQQQGFVGGNTVSINIASLPAGVYSVRLYYGNDLCTSTFIKL